MGQVNAKLRHYCSNKRRFADLINGIYFGGRRVVLESELSEGSEIYSEPVEIAEKKDAKNKYLERTRDLKMINKRGGTFVIFALENQNGIDYSMPFRDMQYDALQYQSQLDEVKTKNEIEKDYLNAAEKLCHVKKTDKLWPVFTLCLYWGEEVWDGPRSLKDMMDFAPGDELEAYFADYPFRLYCLNEVHDYSVFQTEIRSVFELLQYRKNKQGLLQKLKENSEYQRIDVESLEVLTIVLKMPGLWKRRREYLASEEGKEEAYNMCQAIEELMKDSWDEGMEKGKEEGREEGRLNTIVELVRDGLLKLEEAAVRLNLAPEELLTRMSGYAESKV